MRAYSICCRAQKILFYCSCIVVVLHLCGPLKSKPFLVAVFTCVDRSAICHGVLQFFSEADGVSSHFVAERGLTVVNRTVRRRRTVVVVVVVLVTAGQLVINQSNRRQLINHY